MHELSLCHSIVGVVNDAADGRPVDVVYLRVGRLRQVIPDTLVYCWGLVTEGTSLDGSRLEVESVPVTLHCQACSATTEVANELILTCQECGSGAIDVTAGEEFMIMSLELKEVPPHGSIPSPR